MNKTHRAVHWQEDMSLRLGKAELIDPDAGQIQIAVGSAGICGSDLHFFRGDFPARPGIVPGHEIAGVVSKVGAGVTHVFEGDLVGVEPLLRCGTCRFCVTGDYHVCGDRGLVGENASGGMADFVTVPANTAFKAPAGLDAELAALAEPLACSVHGFAKVRLAAYETVFILGAGSIGLTALVVAKAYGAKTIILARHSHQQAAARELGADEVIADDEAGHERIRELRHLQAIDVSVETVGGKGDTLMQAQMVVRPKGRLLVLGVFSVQTVPINPLHLALREVEIIGSMTYAASDGHADYDQALNILSDYPVARCLVTHRFSLDQVAEAFAAADDKRSGSIKVHFQPREHA
jgi:L-iditol 2-dehydrogenase